MASLTLIEQAKGMQGREVEQAVVEVFATSTPILEVLPFREIGGNSYTYSREQRLPGVAFRGVNESFTPTRGVVNPITETLTIVGGEIEVDNFTLHTEGEDVRAREEAMQIKSIAEEWQRAFFKGDSSTNPREMDGLQRRITGNQLIPAGATAGGDALSLVTLDTAISRVMNPTHLLMNKKMRIRLQAAARDVNVGGYITFGPNEFGRRIMRYHEIPILEVEDAAGEDTVLPFSETNPGGGTPASTSIYVLSIGPNMVEGIQNGGMQVRDIGEMENKPAVKTRLEWYSGLTVKHGRSAARLHGIKDVAVVA